jgi:hypothetical protein
MHQVLKIENNNSHSAWKKIKEQTQQYKTISQQQTQIKIYIYNPNNNKHIYKFTFIIWYS